MRHNATQSKITIGEIVDGYGWEVENTPTGEMRVVQPVRLVGANFEGTTVDPNFWVATVAATGTVTQAEGRAILATGINAAGAAYLHSNRRGRYVGGSGLMLRAVAQLRDAPVANNTRRIGVGYAAAMPTVTDGAWFEISGTDFRLVIMRATVPTIIANGTFNGDLGPTWNPTTNVYTWEIYWTNNSVWFAVGDDVLHIHTAPLDTWSTTMNPHIYVANINTGNVTDVGIHVRVASIRRLGLLQTQCTSRWQSGTTAGTVLKYGAGNLHGLVLSGIVNNSNVTLYDNVAAAGTVIFSTGAMPANATPFDLHFQALPFSIGLTLVIATANANATVIYE